MAQSLFEEIGFDKVLEIMAAATAKAARKADELGLPHAEHIDGEWMYRYPDGSTKPFSVEINRKVAEAQIINSIAVPVSKDKIVK